MNNKQLGINIKNERKRMGLTQTELADILNVSSNYISAIECGKKTPKLEMFFKIADALGVNLDTLAGDITISGKKEFLAYNITGKHKIDSLSNSEYNLLKNIINSLIEHFEKSKKDV